MAQSVCSYYPRLRRRRRPAVQRITKLLLQTDMRAGVRALQSAGCSSRIDAVAVARHDAEWPSASLLAAASTEASELYCSSTARVRPVRVEAARLTRVSILASPAALPGARRPRAPLEFDGTYACSPLSCSLDACVRTDAAFSSVRRVVCAYDDGAGRGGGGKLVCW
ncbi:hypothetical protein GUJ93_ZPchr0001g31244 [Zizania palustris]|uniref:Uncharacterized protein n=1 Tax=Zizania palustris TaxID=103762 RepID=A0A8J5RVD8_ZIZPA|nr:hypothetical protein GUJ93_ZPchr0001g31244 [Zizania palustris]